MPALFRKKVTIPTVGLKRKNHSTPATTGATAYGQMMKVLYTVAPRRTRSAITASSSAAESAMPATAKLKTSVTRKEARYSLLAKRSAKLSNPTKAEDVPKASSWRKDCSSAWEAGQMKKTRVTTIWGATRR